MSNPFETIGDVSATTVQATAEGLSTVASGAVKAAEEASSWDWETVGWTAAGTAVAGLAIYGVYNLFKGDK